MDTGLVLPSLRVALDVLNDGKHVVAYSDDQLWVYESSPWSLLGVYGLPRDELRNWITRQSFYLDRSRLRIVREQFITSMLETLELDLQDGSMERVSLIDFEIDPKPGFSAEADLLAVDRTGTSAVVSRRYQRRIEPPAFETHCDFEIYDLANGQREAVIEARSCGPVGGGAVYLESGLIALADDLREEQRGRLRVVEDSGDTVLSEEWNDAQYFSVHGEVSKRWLAVSFRNHDCPRCLEFIDLETRERRSFSSNYDPIRLGMKGIFVGDRSIIMEVGADLQARVVLEED